MWKPCPLFRNNSAQLTDLDCCTGYLYHIRMQFLGRRILPANLQGSSLQNTYYQLNLYTYYTSFLQEATERLTELRNLFEFTLEKNHSSVTTKTARRGCIYMTYYNYNNVKMAIMTGTYKPQNTTPQVLFTPRTHLQAIQD